MIRQLLEEVKAAPLDESGRARLASVLETSIVELKDGLAPELDDELNRLIAPFSGPTPSESELRIAQATLVGWLEGLFHGIQTAIYAQQMAARAQLEQMRKALPPGMIPHPRAADGAPGSQEPPGTGFARRDVSVAARSVRPTDAPQEQQTEQPDDHQGSPGRSEPGELGRVRVVDPGERGLRRL